MIYFNKDLNYITCYILVYDDMYYIASIVHDKFYQTHAIILHLKLQYYQIQYMCLFLLLNFIDNFVFIKNYYK